MKMDDAVVAGRYAKALFEVALAQGQEDHVGRDLEEVGPILREMGHRLIHPGLSIKDKKEAISKAFGKKISPITHHFFQLLVEKHRFSLWPLVVSRFSSIFLEKKNVLKANVFVSRLLDDATQKQLSAQLGMFSGMTIELDIKKDSSLIGGIIVHMGDWVMDSSLRGRLKRMKETFNGN